MPRVRFSAGGRLTGAMLAAAVSATTALAANVEVGASPRPAPISKAAPAAAKPRPGDIEARRRDEIDALQRQDVADALKRRFNIDVDWRTTPLDRLVDIRVRAAKAAELQQRLGVSVDWQRYSWIELEALRRTLLNFEQYRDEQTPPPSAVAGGRAPEPPPHPSARTDDLISPTFKTQPVARGGQRADPDGVIRPTFAVRPAMPVVARDPDGVMRPTFMVRPAMPVAARDPDGVMRPTFMVRPRLSTAAGDPDGLIAPTFTRFRRASSRDGDGVTDPARPPDEAATGARAPARW